MSYPITIRQDPAANWTAQNPTLPQFCLGYETDTGKAKLGTGLTAWNDLDYFDAAGAITTRLDAVSNAAEGSLFYADGNGNLVEFEGGAVLTGSFNGIFLAGSILPNADFSGASDVASVLGTSLHSIFWPGVNLTGQNLNSGLNFTNAVLTNANLTNANLGAAVLTNANLTGALCEGTDFTGATMPANADTKAEFKALVGAWNAVSTTWTDGNPIGA